MKEKTKVKASNVFAAIGLTLLFLVLWFVSQIIFTLIFLLILSLISKTFVFNGIFSVISFMAHGEFDLNWFLTTIIALVPIAGTSLCLGKLIEKNEVTGRLTMLILGIVFIVSNLIFGVINIISGNSVAANIVLLIAGISFICEKN